jgi:hypothetical protein
MAAITTYTTLKTAIDDETARSLSSYVDLLIQLWEEDFLREPKNFGRWMETSLSSTIAANVIAVPASYLGLKYAYVDGSPSSRLDRVSLNQLYGTYPRGGDTGRPRWIAREVTNFVFGPTPDSTYTIKGVYWAKPTALRSAASDAIADWRILNAPDLCLFGALAQAEAFLKNDTRVTLWQGLYDRALQSYRALQRDEEQSGSPSQEVLG